MRCAAREPREVQWWCHDPSIGSASCSLSSTFLDLKPRARGILPNLRTSARAAIRARAPPTSHRYPWLPRCSYIVEGGTRSPARSAPRATRTPRSPSSPPRCSPTSRSRSQNVPRIRDCRDARRAAQSARRRRRVDRAATRSTSTPRRCAPSELDPVLCAKIRASILLAGPLLARCGERHAPATRRRRHRPPPPRHALPRARAAGRRRSRSARSYVLTTNGLRGADVFLDEPSVTGTENALMAARGRQGHDHAPQRRQRAARAGPRALSRRDGRPDRRHRHEHHHDRTAAHAARRDASRSAPITSRSARSSGSPRSRDPSSASRTPASSICARR